MRFVTFVPPDGPPRAGVLLGEVVIDLAAAAPLLLEESRDLRWDLLSVLRGDQDGLDLDTVADLLIAVTGLFGTEQVQLPEFAEVEQDAYDLQFTGSMSLGGETMLLPLEQVRLLAPLPRPTSLRLFNSFAEHARSRAAWLNQPLAAEWRRIAGFAFADHGAILGPDSALPTLNGTALDFEPGLACVIGRRGWSLDPSEAWEYVAGFALMVALVDRDREMEEVVLGCGPAAARLGFALGPWLATPDELEIYTDDDGSLSLDLNLLLNDRPLARSNAAAMTHSFAAQIARASQTSVLRPGDVFFSGPFSGSTLLEQTKGLGPWLDPNDELTFEATGLGSLRVRLNG